MDNSDILQDERDEQSTFEFSLAKQQDGIRVCTSCVLLSKLIVQKENHTPRSLSSVRKKLCSKMDTPYNRRPILRTIYPASNDTRNENPTLNNIKSPKIDGLEFTSRINKSSSESLAILGRLIKSMEEECTSHSNTSDTSESAELDMASTPSTIIMTESAELDMASTPSTIIMTDESAELDMASTPSTIIMTDDEWVSAGRSKEPNMDVENLVPGQEVAVNAEEESELLEAEKSIITENPFSQWVSAGRSKEPKLDVENLVPGQEVAVDAEGESETLEAEKSIIAENPFSQWVSAGRSKEPNMDVENLVLGQEVAVNAEEESETLEAEKSIIAENPFREPGAPDAPDIADWDKYYIDLKWLPPSKITGYVIEKREKGNPKWTKAAEIRTPECKGRADNLDEGVEYEFRIRAVTEAGPGEPSKASKSVVTKPRKYALCRTSDFSRFGPPYLIIKDVMRQRGTSDLSKS